ncbi:MAG: hypothetical protein NTX52_04675 [Planctomycetota bacterium]|nr:hypothetical protein [Planctomycetota bacterium]
MKISLIILGLVFLFTGCAEPTIYTRRDQIAIGMTKQEIAQISSKNPVYLCNRIQRYDKYDLYRLFLSDSEGRLRPYICKFSHDGVLFSIKLDQSYEDFAIENAAGVIRNQTKMTDSEPMYWSK